MSSEKASQNRHAWFLRGLAPKMASLTTVLNSLRQGEAGSAAELRNQAQFLAETAEHYGSSGVSQAARGVLDSSDEELGSSAQRLLDVLVAARARVDWEAPSVLVAGGNDAFATALGKQLPPELGRIEHVDTAEEADRALEENYVAAAVLHLTLPEDGAGSLFAHLRSCSATASVPVLFVGGRLKKKIGLSLSDEDSHQKGKPDADRAAVWVATRLRRAHERARTPWRDRPTGLMNRALFNACGEDVLKDCVASQEPITLAMVRLDESAPRELADRVGVALSEHLRSTDVVARWDTLTFAVLLPGEDEFGARKALEKVQSILNKGDFSVPGVHDGPPTLTARTRSVSAGQSVDQVAQDTENSISDAAGKDILSVPAPNRTVCRQDNILLVSADKLLGKVLVSLLEQEHFRTTVVADSEKAIENCQGHRRYQLIVIDEKLETGGRAALKALKNLERNLQVPTVMVMEQDSSARPADYLALGAFVCLERPLDATTFAKRMRELAWTNAPFHDPSRGLYRLLVADDDPTQLYLAATTLNARGGIHVSLAKGEKDAARRLREDVFEAVIVPATMLKRDDTNGFSIHQTFISPDDIGIIIMVDAESSRHLEFAHEVAGVLTKPIEWVSLGGTIETMLGLDENRARERGPENDLSREVQRIASITASQTRN